MASGCFFSLVLAGPGVVLECVASCFFFRVYGIWFVSRVHGARVLFSFTWRSVLFSPCMWRHVLPRVCVASVLFLSCVWIACLIEIWFGVRLKSGLCLSDIWIACSIDIAV